MDYGNYAYNAQSKAIFINGAITAIAAATGLTPSSVVNNFVISGSVIANFGLTFNGSVINGFTQDQVRYGFTQDQVWALGNPSG